MKTPRTLINRLWKLKIASLPLSCPQLLLLPTMHALNSGLILCQNRFLIACHIFFLSAYTHLGCWRDTGNRAVPQIDGSDPRIRGNYKRRDNAINRCFQVARQRKMVLFAVQDGGWCAAAANFKGYLRYGKSNKCRNGKGGPWANDVYRITNPIRPALPKGN